MRAQSAAPQAGAAGHGPAPATEPAAPAQPPAAIEGFRDAHFGMTEDQVRDAVHKDFPAFAAHLKSTINQSEKTTILSLPARDLLPTTGAAEVSYIIGYRSKKLIQVNILWSSDGTGASDETVVGTANALRDYFLRENYKPGTVVANRPLAPHTLLVFRATDTQGRLVAAILNGAGAALRNAAKGAKPPPLSLELSYIADPAHPDVYRIAKGQF